jgi:membrane protein DedA with SNARE-associated domain
VLDRIVELLTPYLSAPWGYLLVGAATFLENSVGAGVVVPGETLVVLGGFYARLGRLELSWLIPIVCLAAILGDNVGFLIGRRVGRGFLERQGHRLFVTPDRLARADRYYEAHGGKTVFLGRFVPVVRSVGFIVAGAARMPWRRFLAYDVAGAVLWAVGHTVLGYLIGGSYQRWKGYLTPAGLLILAVLVAMAGAGKLLAARRALRAERADPPGPRRDLEADEAPPEAALEPSVLQVWGEPAED